MEKTKYKFVETTGCTAFNYTINDQPISEMPKEELDKILDYLFVKIKEGIEENSILFENVVSLFQYDEYEHDDYRCESCGDHRSSTTWNI